MERSNPEYQPTTISELHVAGTVTVLVAGCALNGAPTPNKRAPAMIAAWAARFVVVFTLDRPQLSATVVLYDGVAVETSLAAYML